MTLHTARVSVGTTATRLTNRPGSTIRGGSSTVTVQSMTPFYIGGPDVTAQTGYLVSGGPFTTDLTDTDHLYGVVGLTLAPATVSVFQTGV